MKKFLAMLLAIMMVMSCTVAMADQGPSTNDRDQYDGDPLTKGQDTPIQFVADGTNGVTDNSSLQIKDVASRFQQEDGTQGEVDTELWMQVAANGQIDVTVPLVLVFSTNIDGGDAMVAENYKIINNNTRNSISVDKIKVDVEPKFGENDADMTLVKYDAFWDASVRDQYKVTLTLSMSTMV